MSMRVGYDSDNYEFEGSACLVSKNGGDSLPIGFFESDIENLVREAGGFVAAIEEGEEGK